MINDPYCGVWNTGSADRQWFHELDSRGKFNKLGKIAITGDTKRTKKVAISEANKSYSGKGWLSSFPA